MKHTIPTAMSKGMDWLAIAREWRRTSNAADPAHGRREALANVFAGSNDINPSSLRRCAAALRFAEQLVAAKLIGGVDELAGARLEHITLMQRVARLDKDEAMAMLPSMLSSKKPAIKDLRAAEAAIRSKRTPTADDNAFVHRLGAAPFRDLAYDTYEAAALAEGRQVVRLNGRGVSLEAAHAVARVQPGGPFHAARFVPATGVAPDAGRYGDIARLATALARIFVRFDLVVQSRGDAEHLKAKLLKFGPCGAGVMVLIPRKSDQPELKEVHAARRKGRPDLLATHADKLDGFFQPTRKS